MWILVAWICSFSGATANGADSAVQLAGVRVGLDGTCKVGAWTAIECDLIGPQGMEITPVMRAADPDGQATLQPLPPVTLAGTEPVRARGSFRTGKLNATLQLQLWEGDQLRQIIPLRAGAQSPAVVLEQSTSVWVCVGQQPVFVRGLELWDRMAPGSSHLIGIDDIDERIWSSEVLDGVDALVLNGETPLREETSLAIRDWVSQGGRLIVPVGDAVDALAESPLSDWLPLIPQGQINIAKLSGIQSLVPRSSVLRTLAILPAAQLDREQGVTVASGLSGPLVMRAAYGIGQVTMVAVRMDQDPLASWEAESQGQLIAVLADIPLPWDVSSAGKTLPEVANFDPSSVTDLQTQLNHSLDTFEGIQRAAPWSVIGWIALFALVIGPLDYYLVRHWLKRPEWTWGTLALWTALASGLAITRGNALNDHAGVAKQIDLIDLDLTLQRMWGHSWYGFYSDQNQRYRIAAAPSDAFQSGPTEQIRVSWIDRPGEGFRGMSGSGGTDESQPSYRFFTDQAGIENFPVRQWSTGAVSCEWGMDTEDRSLVIADIEAKGPNRMSGTIVHHLPGELTDWFLAYGNFVYFERSSGGRPDPLLPGESWNVADAGSNLLPGRLASLIKLQTTGADISPDDQFHRMAYDVHSTDPFNWGLAASFYQAIGGESYTGLRNEALRHLDLSSLLKLKRAVLFGRLKLASTDFQIDSGTLPMQEQAVMIRVIIPVKAHVRDTDAPPSPDLLKPPK